MDWKQKPKNAYYPPSRFRFTCIIIIMAGVLVWSSLSSLKAKQYPISAPKVAEIVSQVDVILKEVVSEKNEIFRLFASELHSTLQHVLEQASLLKQGKHYGPTIIKLDSKNCPKCGTNL